MLHNLNNKALLKKVNFKAITKRWSALYINGPKATDNYVFVTPQIDLIEYIKHKDIFQSEINKRNVQIDLNKLENLVLVYEELKSKKTEYDNRKEDLSKELQKLLKENQTGDNIEKLKIQVKLLKENIKKLKEPLWSAEEAAMLEALKVPNRLYKLTPTENRNIIYEHGLKPLPTTINHHIVGRDKDLIQINNNKTYYLKGDAAIFELGAKFYVSKILKENNFIQFSNPDFTKSVVIEGCGEDHTNPVKTFILHHNEQTKVNADSRLHLTGGGSLYSFFAYHTKNVLYGKVFPLKYFSLGRQYIPSLLDENSLFHVSQSSVIQMFIATKNVEELDDTLNTVIDIIKNIYNKLGYHYRLSFIPASELCMWESLRLAIEMFSSSQKSYVEVGNISLSGDFISKRLMFTYTDDKESKFPHILSGTVLNVPKLLACILERDVDLLLPQQLRIENWNIG